MENPGIQCTRDRAIATPASENLGCLEIGCWLPPYPHRCPPAGTGSDQGLNQVAKKMPPKTASYAKKNRILDPIFGLDNLLQLPFGLLIFPPGGSIKNQSIIPGGGGAARGPNPPTYPTLETPPPRGSQVLNESMAVTKICALALKSTLIHPLGG